MRNKTVKRFFSAVILLLALLLASVVVYAAGGPEFTSYRGSYASVVKIWDDTGYEEQRPHEIKISLEYKADDDAEWAPRDVTVMKPADENGTWETILNSSEMLGTWRVPAGGITETSAENYEMTWSYDSDSNQLQIKNTYKPQTTYTVTYTDGVDDEEVFTDRVTSNLASGVATPAFGGEPVREGYTFKGWTPVVAETVTENAVYTATWERIVPTVPTVPTTPVAPKYYTVTYTDGVDGEEIFADQVTDRLVYGTKTPDFAGEPVREGYTFEGWTPVVADRVTENAVYTAVWKPIEPVKPVEPVEPENPDIPQNPDVPLNPDIPLAPGEELEKPERPMNESPKLPEETDDAIQPKTGDEAPLAGFAGVMMIAVGALGAVCLMKRKRS